MTLIARLTNQMPEISDSVFTSNLKTSVCFYHKMHFLLI